MTNDQINAIIAGYTATLAGLSATQNAFNNAASAFAPTNDFEKDYNDTFPAVTAAQAQVAKYTALLQ